MGTAKPPMVIVVSDAARDRLRIEFDDERPIALVSINECSFYLDERDAPEVAAAIFRWVAVRAERRKPKRRKAGG